MCPRATRRQGAAGPFSAAILAVIALSSPVPAAAYQVLHEHVANDGKNPQAPLVMDSSGYLYGTTYDGGATGNGTIYRVRSDGTAYTILRSFSGAADGRRPQGRLLLDEASSTLYGTASEGGASGFGTVFKMATDGSTFALLHTFTNGTDGKNPRGGLCLDELGKLYGTSQTTVFWLTTDGLSFGTLHTFAGGSSDGTWSSSGLVLNSNGVLFGTTQLGGAFNDGVVFAVARNGRGYSVIHSFGGSDGANPDAGLTLDASGNIYGITTSGGTFNGGAVFTMTSSGSGFTLLHSLGAPGEGIYPQNSQLVLDASGTLWGATRMGGTSNLGTVFRLQTSGSNFAVVHSFGASAAYNPDTGFVLDAIGNLYGLADSGGVANAGAVYAIRTDGSGHRALHTFLGTADGWQPEGALVSDGLGNLYGTTTRGGANDLGTIYAVKTDGSGYAVLHSFDGTGGQYPDYGLALVAGWLYGTTLSGGGGNPPLGVVFRLQTSGAGFGILHSFTGDVTDGAYPSSGLSGTGSPFYGMTQGGGPSDMGTVYSIDKFGSFTLIRSFSGANGDSPAKGLVLDGFGYLYGTTYSGGSSNLGLVFKLKNDGTTMTTLHTFAGGTDGANPAASLYLDSLGMLYGTTSKGGSSNLGTVYKVKSDGTNYGLLHTFTGGASDGDSPYAGLVADLSGNLYGTTAYGGSWLSTGTVYKVSKTGAGFAVIHAFDWLPDAEISLAPLLFESGNLYGTTERGGGQNAGAEFVIPISCASGDTTAPVVTPPAPITLDQTACCPGATGATSTTLSAFLAGGTATDDCTMTAPLTAQAFGSDITPTTCFGAGSTTVTFRFQDAYAHIGTATSAVTVRLFGDLNLDGVVDPSDMVVLRAFFNFAITPGTPPFTAPLGSADVDHSTMVDPSDLVVLRAFFNFAVSCLAP